MERSETPNPEQTVATIDQKAMRLSALLRDVDNHPVRLEPEVRERLDNILEVLEYRIAATRALLRERPEVGAAT